MNIESRSLKLYNKNHIFVLNSYKLELVKKGIVMNTISNYSDLVDNLEQNVAIVGEIAKAIWQHLTTYVDSHPFMNYFDLNDGHQIVIYTKKEISC